MTVYELSVGILILLLSLFTDDKSFSLPISSVVFVFMAMLDIDLLLNSSLSLNAMIVTLFFEYRASSDSDSFFSIALKNKRLFPFSDNVVIALSKTPYVFLYLKEGSVIRLRCSLKELLSTQSTLKKISRNTAISPDVRLKGKNRFIYNDKTIDSNMVLSWGYYSGEKDDT